MVKFPAMFKRLAEAFEVAAAKIRVMSRSTCRRRRRRIGEEREGKRDLGVVGEEREREIRGGERERERVFLVYRVAGEGWE